MEIFRTEHRIQLTRTDDGIAWYVDIPTPPKDARVQFVEWPTDYHGTMQVTWVRR